MSSGQTVTIDGREFALDSLSEAARAQLVSLQMTDQEIARVQQQMAILQTARIAYANALQAGLPSLVDQSFENM